MDDKKIDAVEKAPVYKRRRGDRKDGRLLRSIEPIAIFSLYVMDSRNDANNYISDSVELSAIQKYVHKKRNEGFDGMFTRWCKYITNFAMAMILICSMIVYMFWDLH